jgi:inhibitor of KinA
MDARFVAASDRSLLVHTEHVHAAVRAFESTAGVVNLHPAYSSVLVVFDPFTWTHESLEPVLAERLAESTEDPQADARVVEIPVVYSGPDLPAVAEMHGLTVERVIELHCRPLYTVAFLGFMPGFAYLQGLPDEIATPRLETPRKTVPKGSVGIAGSQTGVYPFASPGGWRLIGHTDLEMFRVERPQPSTLRIGDRVRFVPA